jgi:hypothetical protein
MSAAKKPEVERPVRLLTCKVVTIGRGARPLPSGWDQLPLR